MRWADVDAVTVDAHGTLLELRDPVPALQAALAAHRVRRRPDEVAAALRVEVEHYRAAKRLQTDLAALRRACAAVFLEAAGADVDADAFVPAFVRALAFEPVAGAVEALGAVAARGVALALVANWDAGLREHLAGHRLDRRFGAIVVSAEVGAWKPDARPFLLALERLGVEPARAVHVGDDAVDEEGAAVAGLRFAPAPLREAVARWS